MKAPAAAVIAITAVAAAIALFHGNEIQGALRESDLELAGDCKVVLVDGEPDHCVIVTPGTNTPVRLSTAR